MRRYMNERFGDKIDKAMGKVSDLAGKAMGYKEGPYASIGDCIDGAGWQVGKTLDKGEGYIVFQCVRKDSNSMTFGNSFEDVIDAVNNYLKNKHSSLSASDAGDDYQGYCMRVEKKGMHQDAQAEQIAEVVKRAVKLTLNEINRKRYKRN